MIRLFVAIELPEMHRLHLSMLGGPLKGAKWVAAADMHLTLRFVGQVEGTVADDLVEELDRIEQRAFTLAVDGLGTFGGGDTRTVWAGFSASVELSHLNKLVERAARNAGLGPPPHPFEPHVTLARCRGARQTEVAEWMGARGGFTLPGFEVDHFSLMSARIGGGGPYAVEATFPLFRSG